MDQINFMNCGITLAITSRLRHDLLKRTLESLSAHVDLPIHETIIIEDSELPQPAWLNEITNLGTIRWISNGKRLGQVLSIDRLYDQITTDYIFHCEEDWDFIKQGDWLAQSIQILEQHPEIWTVSLRGNDCNFHPNIDDPKYPFQIQLPYWLSAWGGCNWNPSVRRMSDYRKIGSYGKIMGYNSGGIVPEQTLSKFHLDMGYRIAVLPGGSWIKHTGDLRSQASIPIQQKPKMLIAIPVCHAYEYGKFTSGIDRVTTGRIQAQRDTWIKDVSAFKDYVDCKYFFGISPNGTQPQADEVFLNVPDDYEHLPDKMKEIYRYALAHGYDFVYKCDDDTFVYVDRLMRSGFEQYDQMGFSNCPHGLNNNACGCYITGGAGYTLSRKAMELIVNASPLPENNPHRWAEDYTTGAALMKQQGIVRHGHEGFLPGMEDHYIDVNKILASERKYIGLHAVKPEGMHKLYGN